MIKHHRNSWQRPAVLLKALLVKQGLIIKKLAKELSVVVGLVFQKEENFELVF